MFGEEQHDLDGDNGSTIMMKDLIISIVFGIIIFLLLCIPLSNNYTQSVKSTEVDPILTINNYSEFYNLINQYRQDNNLPLLQRDLSLEQTAEIKLDKMVELDCWDHSCGAEDSRHPIENLLIPYTAFSFAGENLAKGFKNSEDALKAWINSPSHKSNLDGTKYTHQGVAIRCGVKYQKSNDNCLIVHHFGGI